MENPKKIMKKNTVIAATLSLVALSAVPAFAQDGAFRDVPEDHWSYSAVQSLAAKKIFLGNGDGTFQGKRSMTRYEMAVIIERMLKMIPDMMPAAAAPEKMDMSKYVTKGDLEAAMRNMKPAPSNSGVSDADVKTLQRLSKEYETELKTLGVDLEATKQRLSNLEKRVAKLEAAMGDKKMAPAGGLQIGGDLTLGARANAQDKKGNPFTDYNGFGGIGKDERLLSDTVTIQNLNIDLSKALENGATAKATITVGNYLDYVGKLTGPAGGRSLNTVAGLGNTNNVYLTEAYVTTEANTPIIGKTGYAIGRQPVQLTPYTLKNIDTDFYFYNRLNNEGNVYIDGVKGDFKLGPVTLTGMGGRVTQNQYADTFAVAGAAPLKVDQLGAVQGKFKVSDALHLTGTYVAHGLPGTGVKRIDNTSVGAVIKIAGRTINGEYAKADLKDPVTANPNNKATDVSTQLLGNADKGVMVGYRDIQSGFTAPGSWEHIANIYNPTNIKGAYGKGTLELAGAKISGLFQSYKRSKNTDPKNDVSSLRGTITKGQWNLMLDNAEIKTSTLPSGKTKVEFMGLVYKPSTDWSLGLQSASTKVGTASAVKGAIASAQYTVKF
jgi:hypothetical protein